MTLRTQKKTVAKCSDILYKIKPLQEKALKCPKSAERYEYTRLRPFVGPATTGTDASVLREKPYYTRSDFIRKMSLYRYSDKIMANFRIDFFFMKNKGSGNQHNLN